MVSKKPYPKVMNAPGTDFIKTNQLNACGSDPAGQCGIKKSEAPAGINKKTHLNSHTRFSSEQIREFCSYLIR